MKREGSRAGQGGGKREEGERREGEGDRMGAREEREWENEPRVCLAYHLH